MVQLRKYDEDKHYKDIHFHWASFWTQQLEPDGIGADMRGKMVQYQEINHPKPNH